MATTPWLERPVLLAGATGYIGSRLYPHLIEDGLEVRSASRHPEHAAEVEPAREWVEFDVERPETLVPALEGCGAAFYLIHQMGGGEGYAEREKQGARAFVDAAEEAGVERIVYLGGIAPIGPVSPHLQSRLETGAILRHGDVSTVELRASMIVGYGSTSWKIVRDLAARLPLMILPSWTRSRTQPVWEGDVMKALLAALALPAELDGWYDIPGPQTLTVTEILDTTARLLGNRPASIGVPLLSPRLSSFWLKFVSGQDLYVARQLVEGLHGDILASPRVFWEVVDHEALLAFGAAAREAIMQEPSREMGPATLWEEAVTSVTSRRR